MDFGKLYTEHKSFVRNVVLAHGVPLRWVEDIVQEVFLAVMCSAARFEGRSSIRTWIRMIARNKACYWKRAKGNNEVIVSVESIDETHESNDVPLDDRRAVADVLLQLESLTPKQGSSFMMATFDYTAQEISEVQGTTENAVRMQLRVARKKMREYREVAA